MLPAWTDDSAAPGEEAAEVALEHPGDDERLVWTAGHDPDIEAHSSIVDSFCLCGWLALAASPLRSYLSSNKSCGHVNLYLVCFCSCWRYILANCTPIHCCIFQGSDRVRGYGRNIPISSQQKYENWNKYWLCLSSKIVSNLQRNIIPFPKRQRGLSLFCNINLILRTIVR